jgi:cellulose biosynthesis protein BcsQ
MQKIVITNEKGGTGKSTFAALLVEYLNQEKDLKKEVSELKKRVKKLEKPKKGISEAALRRTFF